MRGASPTVSLSVMLTIALSLTASGQSSAWPTPKPCPPEEDWPAGMACVQGGAFMLGDERGRPDERESGMAYVDTFYMDRTEVTNAAYAPCIASGKCKKPMPFRGFGQPEQPVVAVSWFDAVAHCEMLGKRLPTDAEWERAAGGPDDTLTIKWSDKIVCNREGDDFSVFENG